MAGEREGKSESQGLEITLGSRELPVSNLSSMLRVLQAALREIARAEESTRERFSRNPQPTLHLSARTEAGDLILSLSFLDSLDTDPQEDLSSATFPGVPGEARRLHQERASARPVGGRCRRSQRSRRANGYRSAPGPGPPGASEAAQSQAVLRYGDHRVRRRTSGVQPLTAATAEVQG